MPEVQKIVESFSSSSSKVLIVNELGAVGSHLADSLLSLGCQIFYFGNRKDDQIEHLLGRNSFELLNHFKKIEKILNLNYVFYLADERGKFLGNIAKVIKGREIKFLLAFPGTYEISKKLIKELTLLGIDARICLFQEVYGPRLKTGLFSSVIYKAVLGEKIVISSEEVLDNFLVFYLDFIKGITRAMFAPETRGKILDIRGKKTSCFAFLHELEKKIKNPPEVEFLGKQSSVFKKEETFEKGEDFGWRPGVDLEEGLEETVGWMERNKKEVFLKKKQAKKFFLVRPVLNIRKRILLGFCIFILLVSLFFLIPLIAVTADLRIAKSSVQGAKEEWNKGNLVKVENHLQKSLKAVRRAKKTIEIVSPFYSLVGLEQGIRQVELPILIGENLLDSADSLVSGIRLFFPLISSLMKGERVEFQAKVGNLDELLENSYLKASLAWGLLESNFPNRKILNFFGLEEVFGEAKESLPPLRQEINRARILLPLICELTAKEGRRTYLLLFQNNFELRPSGGFISAVGILTFEEGRLLNFEVQNTSKIDEQLRGQVTPPSKLKDYLGIENWYLKDANWSPDFPVSAQKAAWFFEKETGQIVDGVVGVNLNVLKRVLEATGEIYLPEEKEKINAKNFLEKSVYASQFVLFPDPKFQENFLKEVVRVLFERTREQVDDRLLLKFAKSIFSSLVNKDLMIVNFNPKIGEVFRAFNWDGFVEQSSGCQGLIENCFDDYLFINEANLGLNKANYFLKRTVEQSVTLNEEGRFSQTLKISYQNLSLSESWPQGRYKNYLRIYLPKEVILESVMINDPAEPNFWVQLPEEKIDFATESGRLSLGFLIEVPIKSRRIIEIKYSFPQRIDLAKSFTYILLNQKQSGTGETPYSFTFTYPSRIKPLKVLPKGEVLPGKILINENLDKDKIFRIDFGRRL